MYVQLKMKYKKGFESNYCNENNFTIPFLELFKYTYLCILNINPSEVKYNVKRNIVKLGFLSNSLRSYADRIIIELYCTIFLIY